MASLPIAFAQDNWYSASFIAARLNVSLRTVQKWAQLGFFARMGLKVVYAPAKGWSGRAVTWVQIPSVTKYVRFKSCAIDFHTLTSLSSENGRVITRSGTPSLR